MKPFKKTFLVLFSNGQTPVRVVLNSAVNVFEITNGIAC